MTNSEINRAVAERLYECAYLPSRHDFATSLDAMAEAEATLTASEWRDYATLITSGLPDRVCKPIEIWRALLSVPARTRALAFLTATAGRSKETT